MVLLITAEGGVGGKGEKVRERGGGREREREREKERERRMKQSMDVLIISLLVHFQLTYRQYLHLLHLGMRQFAHFPQRTLFFRFGLLVEGSAPTELSEENPWSVAEPDTLAWPVWDWALVELSWLPLRLWSYRFCSWEMAGEFKSIKAGWSVTLLPLLVLTGRAENWNPMSVGVILPRSEMEKRPAEMKY